MRVFVPIEDDSVDPSCGRIFPYRFGVPCEHAMREPLPTDVPSMPMTIDAREVEGYRNAQRQQVP